MSRQRLVLGMYRSTKLHGRRGGDEEDERPERQQHEVRLLVARDTLQGHDAHQAERSATTVLASRQRPAPNLVPSRREAASDDGRLRDRRTAAPVAVERRLLPCDRAPRLAEVVLARAKVRDGEKALGAVAHVGREGDLARRGDGRLVVVLCGGPSVST